MSNSLPDVGARAVVENMPKFEAAMAAVNKALDASGAKAEQAAKRSSALDRAHERMAAAAQRASRQMGGAMGGITAAVSGMAAKVVAAIGTVATVLAVGLAAAVGVAVAGIGALVGALSALAARGAGYEGIIDSFERLTASVQVSANALMDDLRAAAAGTVADLDLLKGANLALAGASGEAGKMFGESLPRLMEIARAQARATGQDVTFLYESLISGIKRSSPMLIDNTGLVLKIGEANEAYAESMGITVEQMSAQDRQMALLQATLEAGEAAVAALGDAQETLAEKTARARTAITNTFDYLSIALQPLAKAIMDPINELLVGIANFTRSAMPYIQAIGELLLGAIRPFMEQISGVAEQLNSPEAASAFFRGAANTFGAFLRGVVMIGVEIVQAVANIANAIADFLIGQSPPPKGPLSNIDVGGRNVMLAWLEGFVGGFSLEPVERVAAQVTGALGAIGRFSYEQVEARLAQLDTALAPFQNRLAIVKADFDAISRIADIALGKVDRQLTSAVQALIRGEAGSGALVRQLDAQRQAIEETLAAQREQTEGYELQLAIASALQARERALLAIRKGQVAPLEQTSKAIVRASKAAAGAGAKPKEEKEKTGSGTPELPELPGAEFAGAALENLFAGIDPAAVGAARDELEAAFGEGFGDAGELWEVATADLTSATERLEKGLLGLGDRIQTAIDEGIAPFRQFATDIGTHIETAYQSIKKFVEIDVPTFFGSIPDKIEAALITLGTQIQLHLVQPIQSKIDTYIAPLFADSATEGSIAYFFAQIPTQIQTALAGLGEWVNTHLVTPIQQKVDDVKTAFDTFFNSEGEGTLRGIIDSALTYLEGVPQKIGEAFSEVGGFVWDNFAVPVINIINTVLGALEGFIINTLRALANMAGDAAQLLEGISPGAGAPLFDLTVSLSDKWLNFTIGRISIDRPGFLQTPGAARGGVFGPGALRVHRGEELIASSARQLTVFPARVVRAMEAMASVQPASATLVHPSVVNTSRSTDNSRHYGDFIFQGTGSPQDTLRRWATAKAFI